MIKVIFGDNLDRKQAIVEKTATPRSVLEDAGFDYSRGALNLDGATLRPGDIDKTFEELGVTEKCYLLSVVKMNNAR